MGAEEGKSDGLRAVREMAKNGVQGKLRGSTTIAAIIKAIAEIDRRLKELESEHASR